TLREERHAKEACDAAWHDALRRVPAARGRGHPDDGRVAPPAGARGLQARARRRGGHRGRRGGRDGAGVTHDLVIRGAKTVFEDGIREADIAIDGERIAAVTDAGAAPKGKREIKADGLV